MTDDDNSGWNAFKKVLPSVNIKHLLCKWHTVRAWRRKIQKVVQNKYLQNEIYYNKCLTISCMELCDYLYTCDCPDFNRICKHIHKIHSYTNRSSFQQYNSNSSLSVTISHSPETPLMNDNQLQESVTSPSGFNDHNKQILQFYKNLDELKMLLQNKNVQVMRLANVNLVLRDLIDQCKAVVDISTDKLNQETSKLSSETDEKKYMVIKNCNISGDQENFAEQKN